VSFVLLLLVLAVIGGIAVVAAGGGGALAPSEPERGPRGGLPDGELDRSAIDRLRFTLAFRGYRMDEVDDVLDRLGRELEQRDLRIAELGGAPPRLDSQRSSAESQPGLRAGGEA
jgi:DivIVA domain-containing protein